MSSFDDPYDKSDFSINNLMKLLQFLKDQGVDGNTCLQLQNTRTNKVAIPEYPIPIIEKSYDHLTGELLCNIPMIGCCIYEEI